MDTCVHTGTALVPGGTTGGAGSRARRLDQAAGCAWINGRDDDRSESIRAG